MIQYPPETFRQIKDLRAKALFACEKAPYSMYDGRYYENIFAGLGDLLDYIVSCGDTEEELSVTPKRVEALRAENSDTDGTVGAEIYRYVREVVSV
jgi:hypothetical protein